MLRNEEIRFLFPNSASSLAVTVVEAPVKLSTDFLNKPVLTTLTSSKSLVTAESLMVKGDFLFLIETSSILYPI
ncbi:hypothetical protein D3C87_1008070 [compost metagenome]